MAGDTPKRSRVVTSALRKSKQEDNKRAAARAQPNRAARQQLEASLHESEQRYRSVVAAMAEGVVIQDQDGRIRSCNASACRVLGLTEAQVLGRTSFDPQWRAIQEDGSPFPGETHPAMVTLRTGCASENVIMGVHRPDGSLVWISINTQPIMEGEGEQPSGVVASFRDITAQKQAEEYSRQSEAFVSSVLEHLPHMVFVKEASGLRFVRFNRAGEALLGKAQGELLGRTDYDFFSKPEADFFTTKDREVLANGRLVDIPEETIQTAAGPRILHTKKLPIFGVDGTPQYLLGISEDITERKMVEDNLLRTQFAMDQAVDAVYWIDPQAKILYTNEAASVMLGYTADEFLQMTVHDLNPSFPPEVWPGFWAETREKKVVSLETIHVAKDGRRIPIDIRVSFLAYGGQEFHCAFVRDISERKRVDEALRKSQERFELAARATNDGIWDWNILTGEQYWSDRHLELFGLESRILTPTYDMWIALVHPDDADRVHQATCHHLDTREPYDIEMRVRMKDGRYRWFRDRGQAVWDSTGRPVRMVGSISDVTERRTAEEAIRQAQAELEQRVNERTAELAQANRSLKDEIAERKRVEDRLQRTQYAVDHAADQIFVIGPNGFFLDVNESACRRLGYTKAELLGMSVMDIDPDFPIGVWDSFWTEFTKTKRVRLETRHRNKSGEIYPVEVVANYLCHEGQELDYTIVRDITDRKRSEAALLESEERFSKAFTESAIGMAIVATDGWWLQVNQALCEIVGYSQAELEASTFQAITHPNDLDVELPRMRQMLNGELRTYQLEKRYFHKHGSVIWVVMNVSLVRNTDGTPKHFIAQIQDITERREAEAAIRDSELRYKLLTEATFDGIAIHDQGIFLEVNAGLERMFGYEAGELIGRSLLDLVAEESRERVVANMRAGVSGPYEAIGRRKDGTTFPGEVVVRSCCYRGKEVRLVAGRDITARKHLEAERARHTEELERQVVARTAEIAKLESQRAQTERLAAMGRLAAGVAHEINNPIAGIKNAFTLVKQAVDPAHAQYEFVGLVDREIDRVTSIVQNMYQLYRRESVKAESVDLHTMIGDIEALFAKRLEQQRIRLLVERDSGFDRLDVPRSDLLQVLLNLLTNAMDCSREGGTITMTIREEAEGIRIALADQGTGISPEVLPHIFDPFFTTKDEGEQKGMGLGLSVSQSLVAAMGGRIDVHTQLGQGSTFSVLLPRHRVVACIPHQTHTNKEVITHGC